MTHGREPDGTGAAGPRTAPGQPGHHGRPARRQARRLRAGGPALHRHPARGRHPDRIRPRTVRRLPPRARPAAPAADVQRDRGAGPRHGRARRPPRRERSDRSGRQRARQDRAGAPGAGGRPGRGGPADHGARAGPRRRPARPRRRRPSSCRPARTDRRVRLGYRSEAGSEWVSEVEPWAVVVRHGRWYLLCRSHEEGRPTGLPDRPGPQRRGARRHVHPAGRSGPGRDARGAPRRGLGVRRRGRDRRADRRGGAVPAPRPRPARAAGCRHHPSRREH